MLNIMIGRAGTGKTTYVMNEIRRRMETGEQGLLLIVPEQYSHDAERQLCAVCGDALSLHGETLSFSRLCGRVAVNAGGLRVNTLDGGGQILAMFRAFDSVAPGLKAFNTGGNRAEMLERLLDMVKEFKSFNINAEALEQMAGRVSAALAAKLRDLSIILGAYDAVLQAYGGDSADRMTLLADRIYDSEIGNEGHIFFDGFNDFTAQEYRVIGELLRKGAGLTVCLTCPPPGDDDGAVEVFELPRRAFGMLLRLAAENGAAAEVFAQTAQVTQAVQVKQTAQSAQMTQAEQTACQGMKAGELAFLEKNLFAHTPVEYPGECEAVTVYSAQSRYAECEYAAYKVWQLVRGGCRWRDVGVMARDWDTYGRLCENVFEKYGVPFFSGGRNDILDMPPAALIEAALEIAASGWEYKAVFRYLKTGLLDISQNDCAELENYVLKWNIRGSAWARKWSLPPTGYGDGNEGGHGHSEALTRLNELRRRITGPLFKLREGIKGNTGAEEKLRALYVFFDDIELPERLQAKALALVQRGETRLADEYSQVWGIIRGSAEQMSVILGDSVIGASGFRRLFSITLSQYDVGAIPAALDRTALGGILMSRRRDLKHLIILGASDDSLPMIVKGGGLLSDSERDELAGIDAGIRSGPEERLYREMNAIYSTVTLPSQSLTVSYPGGAGERPSFVIKRLKAIFDIAEISPDEDEYMTAAKAPCFELAGMAGNLGNGPVAAAAREYFFEEAGVEAAILADAFSVQGAGRGSLSSRAARQLYGERPAISASRVEKYFACPFAHFLRNGLRLDRRVRAEFDAPEAGTFMHYVIEGVTREIKAGTGFSMADEERCRELTGKYIEKYSHEALYDLEGADARFAYLFRRLEDDVQRIVLDMLEEMKRSDFEPLDFELDLKELPEAEDGGSGGIILTGVVDRVDGFSYGGKKYLRVVDYKTGKKTFSLSDVVYGRDMQMLIYLFFLQKSGGGRYGDDIIPAGVLYVPARDVVLRAPRNITEEELAKMRGQALRRSGLVLGDPAVVEAMENGEEKKYLPVKKSKDGVFTGESLVSAGQLAQLSEYVGGMLRSAADEIMNGSIGCSPYYKNTRDNACLYCEYGDVCGFDEALGGKRRFLRKLGAGEVWDALGRAESGE